MRFHLWQIKVGSNANLNCPPGIMEKVQTKVKYRTRNWYSINQNVCLVKMPPTGSVKL